MTAVAVTRITRGPFRPPGWLGSPPRLRFDTKRALCAGVTIWRVREFQPVSVLDIGVLVPPPEVEVEPKGMYWYEPDWHERAACRRLAPGENYAQLFFSTDGEDQRWTYQSPKVLERARSYCRACPVALQCLTFALDGDERWGVWGGTTGRQRAKLRRRVEHEGASAVAQQVLGD